MTLNLTKTKFRIFMPRQKESHNLYRPLTVANVHLEKSFSVILLGMTVLILYVAKLAEIEI